MPYHDLLPREQDISFFTAHGWWLSPVVLSNSVLETLRTAQDDFYASGRQRHLKHIPDGWQQGRHRLDALRKNDFTSLTNEVFMQQLVAHPFIGAAAGLLMEANAVRLWHDQLLYKPGTSSNAPNDSGPVVGWHTDQSYWKSCTGPMITAWVPFMDCPVEMGPVAMLDKSNHWSGQGPDQSDFFDQDLRSQLAALRAGGNSVEVRPMAMKAGQISFHCWHTIHGSSPNLSPNPRRSMAIHMQSATNHWQAVSSRQTGKQVTHDIDRLVRKDAHGNLITAIRIYVRFYGSGRAMKRIRWVIKQFYLRTAFGVCQINRSSSNYSIIVSVYVMEATMRLKWVASCLSQMVSMIYLKPYISPAYSLSFRCIPSAIPRLQLLRHVNCSRNYGTESAIVFLGPCWLIRTVDLMQRMTAGTMRL